MITQLCSARPSAPFFPPHPVSILCHSAFWSRPRRRENPLPLRHATSQKRPHCRPTHHHQLGFRPAQRHATPCIAGDTFDSTVLPSRSHATRNAAENFIRSGKRSTCCIGARTSPSTFICDTTRLFRLPMICPRVEAGGLLFPLFPCRHSKL